MLKTEPHSSRIFYKDSGGAIEISDGNAIKPYYLNNIKNWIVVVVGGGITKSDLGAIGVDCMLEVGRLNPSACFHIVVEGGGPLELVSGLIEEKYVVLFYKHDYP